MIKVKKVSRNFGHIEAVKDVSFDVERGEVLGFLGPNGAGKTTTMRVVTGYLEPSQGEVHINGVNMQSDPEAAKKMIGYLPENAPVYRDMHVLGFLKFVAAIRDLKGKKASDAIDAAISTCHLEHVLYQSIDTLSKGYTRRTVLAQSILHDPPVLILDEPTDGLDPNQKYEVRAMINRMSKDKAIIISTHILEEVDSCCTRALIIAEGKIIANGTPDELKKISPTSNTVVMKLAGCDFESVRDSVGQIPSVGRVLKIGEGDGSITARVFPASSHSPAGIAPEIASYVVNKGWRIIEIYPDPGKLDEVFRKITLNDMKKQGNDI